MILSMTGYGSAEGTIEDIQVQVEMRTVNGRFFKLHMRTPPMMAPMEAEIESMLRKALQRGSVHLSVQLEQCNADARVQIDAALVKAYQNNFRKLGLSEECIPTLPGVLRTAKAVLTESSKRTIVNVIGQALAECSAMRGREGESLCSVMGHLLDSIVARVDQLAQRLPKALDDAHEKLTQRVKALLENAELDSRVAAQEIALLADRTDITEEIDRLASHVGQVRVLLNSSDPVGRQLDFLAQEMNREANTMGSKSSDAEMGQLVIQLKTDIEKFREQVANIA